MRRSYFLLVTSFFLGACDQAETIDDRSFRFGYIPSKALISALPAAPAEGVLLTVEPKGDTICSRGTPYRFFVRGGDPKRLVLDFAGGGACWNETTCSVQDAIFSPEAPEQSTIEEYYDQMDAAGLYDQTQSDNPIAGWTMMHLPYCTGDVHWGNALGVYDNGGLLVEHRGLVNARTALAWAFDRYPELEQIFVTGCSAGAYGSIGHSPWIADYYDRVRGPGQIDISVLADSGAGIISDDFFMNSFPNWKAESAIPEWIDGLGNVNIFDLDITDLYTKVANAYPKVRFAQYNSAFDADQERYYVAMGGERKDWSPKMQTSLKAIRSESENFRYYLATGPIHCIHPYGMMFERDVAGTKYTTWLGELISGAALPDDVACTDESCSDDPICNACAMGGEGNWCGWCD